MTIVDKIIASIKGTLGQGFPVYYHDEATLNLLTSRMKFPCALFQLLSSGSVVDAAGQLKERVTAAVFFVEPATEWDDDAVANERIIDRCKRRGLYWLSQNSLDDYVTARATRTSRVYDQYDDILTGFALYVEATELYGYSDCEKVTAPDFNDDFNADFNI